MLSAKTVFMAAGLAYPPSPGLSISQAHDVDGGVLAGYSMPDGPVVPSHVRPPQQLLATVHTAYTPSQPNDSLSYSPKVSVPLGFTFEIDDRPVGNVLDTSSSSGASMASIGIFGGSRPKMGLKNILLGGLIMLGVGGLGLGLVLGGLVLHSKHLGPWRHTYENMTVVSIFESNDGHDLIKARGPDGTEIVFRNDPAWWRGKSQDDAINIQDRLMVGRRVNIEAYGRSLPWLADLMHVAYPNILSVELPEPKN